MLAYRSDSRLLTVTYSNLQCKCTLRENYNRIGSSDLGSSSVTLFHSKQLAWITNPF